MIADIYKLEFDKIRTQLSSYGQTDLGRSDILKISPKTDQSFIENQLIEVEQAKIMIQRYDETPLRGVLDIYPLIRKAQIQSVLTIVELMRVVSHQEAVERTQRYIKKVIQLEIDMSALKTYYDRIESVAGVKSEIQSIISNKGEIYDKASPELSKIRRKIKIKEEKIHQMMQSLLKSEAHKLSDSIITIRNQRLVLPVKAEYKNSFNGIVHDQSASRETVFMEPMKCMVLNNELQSLFIDEETEIERILRELTILVGEKSEVLKQNLMLFTYLDVVFAKAKYAVEYDMTRPNLTNKIHLNHARHPLIAPSEVVGNQIYFEDYRHIIITGPNTGGKTVALKTLGLLSVMVQSGMLIPVNDGSETIVFSNIMADIGDEQSIEQSLSTFSSHISNIIRVFNQLEDDSLILLDEIGSGTDPKEGASLAISMMNFIRKHRVYSMVTTHYPELKTYAYDLDDTLNASVEFDLKSLQPTYKLKIGTPGESNAISIARRLGLDASICDEAEHVSISFDTDVSKLVKKLEKQSAQLDAQIEDEKARVESLKKEMDDLQLEKQKMIKEQNRVLKQYALENKENQLKGLKEIDQLIDELNRLRNQAQFKEHKLAELKHKRSQMNVDAVSYEKETDHKIQVGDRVKVLPYQRQGVVNRQLNNGEFEVQMGVLKVTVEEDELEYKGKPKKVIEKVKLAPTPKKDVKVELDLHGLRYVEAMDQLDKFIDNCLLNNLEFAYIVHGIGTMVLKKGVEKYAKSNPQIKSYRSGTEHEGGKGVTIVYFK
jgi:DNA mismatch repair protein MutS2